MYSNIREKMCFSTIEQGAMQIDSFEVNTRLIEFIYKVQIHFVFTTNLK